MFVSLSTTLRWSSIFSEAWEAQLSTVVDHIYIYNTWLFNNRTPLSITTLRKLSKTRLSSTKAYALSNCETILPPGEPKCPISRSAGNISTRASATRGAPTSTAAVCSCTFEPTILQCPSFQYTALYCHLESSIWQCKLDTKAKFSQMLYVMSATGNGQSGSTNEIRNRAESLLTMLKCRRRTSGLSQKTKSRWAPPK